MTINQKVSFEYLGTNFTFNVVTVLVEGRREGEGSAGLLTEDTVWQFETPANSGIKVRHCSASSLFSVNAKGRTSGVRVFSSAKIALVDLYELVDVFISLWIPVT